MSEPLTLRQLSELHCSFWEEQNASRERRLADEAVQETAFARLSDEQKRGVPVRYQAPLEKLLADAEADKKRFLCQQARKGGQSKKSDTLQQAIVELVRSDPAITAAGLKLMLTRDRFPELVLDVDDETITFAPDGSKDGRLKDAPISGLKDRLSRAKKALDSRQPADAKSSS